MKLNFLSKYYRKNPLKMRNKEYGIDSKWEFSCGTAQKFQYQESLPGGSRIEVKFQLIGTYPPYESQVRSKQSCNETIKLGSIGGGRQYWILALGSQVLSQQVQVGFDPKKMLHSSAAGILVTQAQQADRS